MLKWLNTSAVKKAMHVPAAATYFLTDNGVGFNYTLSERNLMPFYRRMNREKRLRILIYNGDTDPGLNTFTAQVRGMCWDRIWL